MPDRHKQPIPEFPVYIFDVDGTLLDSATDICGAIHDVLAPHAPKPLTFEYLKSFVGYHLDVCFLDIRPDFSREQLDALIVQYRNTYWGREHKSTKVYAGIPQALAALPGRKTTATTKTSQTTRGVLELFGILQHFEHVQGTDGFPCKPEPEVLLRAASALGVNPADCLFVGDSAADMEAGHRAGMKTCAAMYGYGNREHMAKWNPDYWIESPAELVARRTA